MPAVDFDRIRDQGKNFVDGFTPGQKAMTILGVIAVVIAGMTFSHWSSSTEYAPLYANLSGADAGKVTAKLDSAGVKWKLADGGADGFDRSRRCFTQQVLELGEHLFDWVQVGRVFRQQEQLGTG